MAVVLMAVSLAATPLVAHAKHNVPGIRLNIKKCNHTYYEIVHTGIAYCYPIQVHSLSDGRSCYVTRLILFHRTYCTRCGAILRDNYILGCEEEHSLCGTVIKGMGH